jgi:hypothetical protein
MTYPREDDEDDAEDHTGMDLAGQAVEDVADGVDGPPEDEHDDAAHGHDVEDLVLRVDGVEHGYVERAEDGDAVDGEMGGGDEEAGEGGDDDGDEGGALPAEGDEGVDQGEGVREQRDRDDQVRTALDLRQD